MIYRLAKKCLCLTLLTSLAVFSGCGEAEDSSASLVEISSFEGPVIEADYSVGTGDNAITINGPSFNVQFTGTNATERNLFIVAVTAEIKGENFEWAASRPDSAALLGYAPSGGNIAWLVNSNLGGGGQILSTFVESLPAGLNRYRITFELAGYFTEQDDTATEGVDESLLAVENFNKSVTVTVKR